MNQTQNKEAEKQIVPIPELVEAAAKPEVKYVSEDEAAKLVGMAGSKESRAMDAETAELEAQMAEMKAQMEAKIKSAKDAADAQKKEVSSFAIEMRKLPVEVSNEIKTIISEDDKLHDEVTKFAKIRIAKEAEFRKFNELRAAQEAEFRKANGTLNDLKKAMKDRMVNYNIPENVANEVLRTKTVEIEPKPTAKAATGERTKRASLLVTMDGQKTTWKKAYTDYAKRHGIVLPTSSFSGYRELMAQAEKLGDAYDGELPRDPDTGEHCDWV